MAGDQIPSRSELLDQLAKGPIVEPRGLLSARLEAMEADGLVFHGWVGEGKLGYRLASPKPAVQASHPHADRRDAPKPMDPERLALLRAGPMLSAQSIRAGIVRELLADRDHWHARAEKSNARAEKAEAEAVQLRAELAQMESGRDDARRRCCTIMSAMSESFDEAHFARQYGWPDLYASEAV